MSFTCAVQHIITRATTLASLVEAALRTASQRLFAIWVSSGRHTARIQRTCVRPPRSVTPTPHKD
eukprot:6002537-Pyramimonas_sp.AAC.1